MSVRARPGDAAGSFQLLDTFNGATRELTTGGLDAPRADVTLVTALISGGPGGLAAGTHRFTAVFIPAPGTNNRAGISEPVTITLPLAPRSEDGDHRPAD
jgi:hypothetical protein